MEKIEYQALYELEDDYWWYVGLRDLILPLMDKFRLKKKALTVLDAGCGTGGFLSRLAGYTSYGFDISEEALKFCRLRKLSNIVRASVCDIPFKSNSFDFAVSLDVLYHKGIKSDIGALEELCRVLTKRGILFLNLPAYDFLRGNHDKVIHTGHRYALRELREKVSLAGFTIEKISYRNTMLFPLVATKRFAERLPIRKNAELVSDLRPLPKAVNKFLRQVLFLENKLMQNLSLPFGLSIFCIARKK